MIEILNKSAFLCTVELLKLFFSENHESITAAIEKMTDLNMGDFSSQELFEEVLMYCRQSSTLLHQFWLQSSDVVQQKLFKAIERSARVIVARSLALPNGFLKYILCRGEENVVYGFIHDVVVENMSLYIEKRCLKTFFGAVQRYQGPEHKHHERSIVFLSPPRATVGLQFCEASVRTRRALANIVADEDTKASAKKIYKARKLKQRRAVKTPSSPVFAPLDEPCIDNNASEATFVCNYNCSVYLDMHGYNTYQVIDALRSKIYTQCKVLPAIVGVITGRGNHSRGAPVLIEHVEEILEAWLGHKCVHRCSDGCVAFVTQSGIATIRARVYRM